MLSVNLLQSSLDVAMNHFCSRCKYYIGDSPQSLLHVSVFYSIFHFTFNNTSTHSMNREKTGPSFGGGIC
jgi:hypothetical protein